MAAGLKTVILTESPKKRRTRMCIVALAWQLLPDCPLVLLNNRDEFRARPTAPLSVWPSGIVAGRDLQAQGTWLGIHPHTRRWAVLTNVREPPSASAGQLSRGQLVMDFLHGERSPLDFVRQIDLTAYPGFNLLVGTLAQAVSVSNRTGHISVLPAGLYVLSNAALDTPWPKVDRLRQRVVQEVLPLYQQRLMDDARAAAFAVLDDGQRFDDVALPDTGVGLDTERLLSSIRIDSPAYGTWSSSVVEMGVQGGFFAEKIHPLPRLTTLTLA